MALLHHPAMELPANVNHSLGFSGDFKTFFSFLLHFGYYFYSFGLSIISFDKTVLLKIIAGICNRDNTAKSKKPSG